MVDTKISALTDGDPALSTDEIPAARAGGNVKLTAGSIAGLASPSDFQSSIVTGYYYTYKGLETSAAGSLAADTLYAIPIWFSSTETWTRIGIDVFFADAGKSARLGIYNNSASNRPGTLLVDAGTVSVAVAAAVEATISQSLAANTLYWLAIVTDTATAQFRQGSLDVGANTWVYGVDDPLQFNDGISFGVAHAFGALPDPFGTVDTTVGKMPLIWLRKV